MRAKLRGRGEGARAQGGGRGEERTLLEVALHGEHEQVPVKEHDVHAEREGQVACWREAPDKAPDTAAASAVIGAPLEVEFRVYREVGLMWIGLAVVDWVHETREAESCLRERAQQESGHMFKKACQTSLFKLIYVLTTLVWRLENAIGNGNVRTCTHIWYQ